MLATASVPVSSVETMVHTCPLHALWIADTEHWLWSKVTKSLFASRIVMNWVIWGTWRIVSALLCCSENDFEKALNEILTTDEAASLLTTNTGFKTPFDCFVEQDATWLWSAKTKKHCVNRLVSVWGLRTFVDVTQNKFDSDSSSFSLTTPACSTWEPRSLKQTMRKFKKHLHSHSLLIWLHPFPLSNNLTTKELKLQKINSFTLRGKKKKPKHLRNKFSHPRPAWQIIFVLGFYSLHSTKSLSENVLWLHVSAQPDRCKMYLSRGEGTGQRQLYRHHHLRYPRQI